MTWPLAAREAPATQGSQTTNVVSSGMNQNPASDKNMNKHKSLQRALHHLTPFFTVQKSSLEADDAELHEEPEEEQSSLSLSSGATVSSPSPTHDK